MRPRGRLDVATWTARPGLRRRACPAVDSLGGHRRSHRSGGGLGGDRSNSSSSPGLGRFPALGTRVGRTGHEVPGLTARSPVDRSRLLNWQRLRQWESWIGHDGSIQERPRFPGVPETSTRSSSTVDGAYFSKRAIVPAGRHPIPMHLRTRPSTCLTALVVLPRRYVDSSGAGRFVNIPRGRLHCFHNHSDQMMT